MKIKDLFAAHKKIFSFEFFPPKTSKGEEALYATIEELKPLAPSFVSVTYGAFGTTQDKSLEVINKIQNEIGLEVMAHYTCIGATEEKVDMFLKRLEEMNVENILALRGDPPNGMTIEEAVKGSPFRYAIDLVRYIRLKTTTFSIGVAGYPEGHVECIDHKKDLEFLKRKVDSGADFVVTQLYFDNNDFFNFIDLARKNGITVPIIPGIMPIENLKQIEKMSSMCGAKIPEHIMTDFNRVDISDADRQKYGIDHAIKQCQELLASDVKGIHFYTLNKSSATREIFRAIQ